MQRHQIGGMVVLPQTPISIGSINHAAPTIRLLFSVAASTADSLVGKIVVMVFFLPGAHQQEEIVSTTHRDTTRRRRRFWIILCSFAIYSTPLFPTKRFARETYATTDRACSHWRRHKTATTNVCGVNDSCRDILLSNDTNRSLLGHPHGNPARHLTAVLAFGHQQILVAQRRHAQTVAHLANLDLASHGSMGKHGHCLGCAVW